MKRAFEPIHGTTILAVRRDGVVAIGGDGQMTQGATVLKSHSRKIRALHGGSVLVGFAGATADAMTLLEKFEGHLKTQQGSLLKAAIELAKEWRTDRMLRRLECMMIAVDRKQTFVLSGSGDVIEPDDDVIAIGSGGPYALAAGRAMRATTPLGAREICERALGIAADICVYTNRELSIETLS